jgi:exonuclease VII small subunit
MPATSANRAVATMKAAKAAVAHAEARLQDLYHMYQNENKPHKQSWPFARYKRRIAEAQTALANAEARVKSAVARNTNSLYANLERVRANIEAIRAGTRPHSPVTAARRANLHRHKALVKRAIELREQVLPRRARNIAKGSVTAAGLRAWRASALEAPYRVRAATGLAAHQPTVPFENYARVVRTLERATGQQWTGTKRKR